MAEPNPATWAAVVPDDTDFNTEIRDPLRWLLGHSSNPKPFLRTRGSAPTSLSNGGGSGAWTEIDLDNSDEHRGFVTALPATIPVDGFYDVGAMIDVDVERSNKALRIRKNGTDTIAQDDRPGVGSPVPARITASTGNVPLVAGDVITIEGYNDAASGAIDALATGTWAPVLWIEYVATDN